MCENSSLGNALSIYFNARAIARVGGLHFVRKPKCQTSHVEWSSIQAWLPYAVDSPVPMDLPRARSACDTCGNNLAHLCASAAWIDHVEQVHEELQDAVTMWEAHRNSLGTNAMVYDEAVIHVRCGDLFSVRVAGVLSQYGFLPYSHYDQIIPQNVSSIGILCQSLNVRCETWSVRPGDCLHVQRCSEIVQHLAGRLRHRFPQSVVTIRDGEDVMVGYARMIRAPMATICNPSTFCFWATIGSMNGYLPRTALFPGANTIADKLPSVNLVPEAPSYISYLRMRGLDTAAIIRLLEAS